MSECRNLRRGLMLTTGLLGCHATAAAQPAETEDANAPVEQITITGRRYGAEELSLSKFTRPLLDTARSVTVIDDALLQEQGRRSLRESLRNVTGIAIDAGEGNPPGGTDAVSIRGFSARDDVFVDGMRDVGLFFRDPFDSRRIEVYKGPGSAIQGRGNVGGSINLVSRWATMEQVRDFELSGGSDDFFRITGDLNEVIDEQNGIAFRLNAMVHDADKPGREEVEHERWAIAPSIGFGLGTDTEFTVSYYHLEQDDRPDGGIPNARNPSLAGSGLEGRPAPVNRDAFFGHSTDFQDVDVDRLTARLDHRFNEFAKVRAQFRYGRTDNNQIISSPRFADGSLTTIDETTEVVGNQKPRKQEDTIIIGQIDATFDFDTAGLKHTVVAGVEASTEESKNRRRLDANGPPTDLFDPKLRPADAIPFNGTRAETETDTVAVYAFDTIEIAPQWLLSGGVRFDHVDTTAQSFDETGMFPDFVVDVGRDDEEVSANVSLVYKPTDESSVYAAWGNSFEANARSEIVQLAGGNNNPPVTADEFDVSPEQTRAVEVGAKWNLLGERLLLTGAFFQIKKFDARVPGDEIDDPAVVLEGEQRVRGFELSAVGMPLPNWNVFAGYTFLDAEVTEANNPFALGQDLPRAPDNSFTFWSSYALTPALTVGGGVQHVGSRTSSIRSGPDDRFVTTVDDYTLVDAFIEFALIENLSLKVNLDNITDKFYFEGVTSGQSRPGPARAVRASLLASF